MKIAVQLDADRNIIGYDPVESHAEIQVGMFGNQGWSLIKDDSAFLYHKKDLWTVRESDNTLVHIATNQTPEEEKNAVITQLTLQNLSLSNDISDLKKLTTAQTLQSLQDAKDKSEQKEVITGLTKEILELKSNATTEIK